jgi:hypothetical protein
LSGFEEEEKIERKSGSKRDKKRDDESGSEGVDFEYRFETE